MTVFISKALYKDMMQNVKANEKRVEANIKKMYKLHLEKFLQRIK